MAAYRGALFLVFYLCGYHLYEFVDVVGCYDAAFLQYDFDAGTQLWAGGGCEERCGAGAYSGAKEECEEAFHNV